MEWHRVIIEAAVYIAFVELFEIGKWAFTDGWSGVLKFHLRLNRQFLIHCMGLLYSGAIFGTLMVFDWRAFRVVPLTVIAILVVPLLVAIPFRSSIRNLFKDRDTTATLKAHELPFPR